MRKQETVRPLNHWIIINNKRHSIWKQPYLSFDEARRELDYQVSQLSPNQKHNFIIERRGYINYDNPDWYEKTVDKDFKDFEKTDEITQSALDNF